MASYEDRDKPNRLPDFYATNRKDWKLKPILTTYLNHWPTENFNEDTIRNLGLEDYQLRQVRAIKRHWYLSLGAYSLLDDQNSLGRSRWPVHGHFHSTDQQCQGVGYELLGDLVQWIAHQIESGLIPDKASTCH